MNKRILAGALSTALCFTSVLSGCSWSLSGSTPEPVILSPVEETAPATDSSILSASGTTQATTDSQYLEITLPGSRVSLVVEEVYVAEGDTAAENLNAFQALVDADGVLYSSQAGYLTSVTYEVGDLSFPIKRKE